MGYEGSQLFKHGKYILIRTPEGKDHHNSKYREEFNRFVKVAECTAFSIEHAYEKFRLEVFNTENSYVEKCGKLCALDTVNIEGITVRRWGFVANFSLGVEDEDELIVQFIILEDSDIVSREISHMN